VGGARAGQDGVDNGNWQNENSQIGGVWVVI
jgi:hypothetical protein